MTIWMLVPDRRLAEMMTRALCEAGHDVRRVESVGTLRQGAPLASDLVVVDLSFAAEGTDTGLIALRGLDPRPRVLALSDRFALHERIVAAEHAAEACLPKPFDAHELLGIVSRIATDPASPR